MQSIVAREIEQGAALNDTAVAELQRLLQAPTDSTLDTLNEQLCGAIKNGAIDAEDPELLRYLKDVTERQVAIDNPKYSGYQQAWLKRKLNALPLRESRTSGFCMLMSGLLKELPRPYLALHDTLKKK